MTTKERLEVLEQEHTATKARLTELRASLEREVVTRGLTVIDENEKPCIELRVDKGGPRLNLFDENGNNRAALFVDKDGPWLALFDENGKDRTALGEDKDDRRGRETNEETEDERTAAGAHSGNGEVSAEDHRATSSVPGHELTSCIGCGRDTRAVDGICWKCRPANRRVGAVRFYDEESRGRHSLPPWISGMLEDREEDNED